MKPARITTILVLAASMAGATLGSEAPAAPSSPQPQTPPAALAPSGEEFPLLGNRPGAGIPRPLVLPVRPLLVGGACCLPSGMCVPASTEAACAALGGVFLAGQDCATHPCGPGACCSETSCVTADAFSCITAGRDFAGAGTLCADNPCAIGVGACCIQGNCLIMYEPACVAAGGNWLGPGTVCGPDACVSGSCCIGESCTPMQGQDCHARGGTFIPGGSCSPNPCLPPNLCPPGTLFSQSPDGPTDFISGTSEESSNLRRWENFSGVAGSIEALTWWGFDLHPLGGSTFSECTESDTTFRISFHEDAGGVPGRLVRTYTLLATRTPVGGTSYLGAELNEYHVDLPTPCVLVNGWISIVGLGDPGCWFLWMGSGSGESYCDHCLPHQQGFDLAICIQGTRGGVFGSCCTDATGLCLDGVEITQCAGPGQRFSPDKTCAQLDPPCGVIIGACCFANDTCEIMTEADCADAGGKWLGASTICSSCPCITPCPPGGIAEGEPTCHDGYIDTYNGGCVSGTIAFSPIALNQTVCGTSGTYLVGTDTFGDFDWYELHLAAPTRLTWTVRAEFRPRVLLINGTAGCEKLAVLAQAYDLECTDVSLTVDATPGTYWLVVVPGASTDTSVCGARYTATVSGTAPVPADLNGDGHVNGLDLALLLGQWTGAATYAPCPPHRPADLNQDCRVNGLDLAMLLAAWTG